MKPVARSLYLPTAAKSTAIKKMQVSILKSKIHRASVTDANVDYEGSITIDKKLMDQAGIYPYERVLCGNMTNGERFETYVISGERESGAVILNGATAHLGKKNDLLTIMSFAMLNESQSKNWEPKVIVLNTHNTV